MAEGTPGELPGAEDFFAEAEKRKATKSTKSSTDATKKDTNATKENTKAKKVNNATLKERNKLLKSNVKELKEVVATQNKQISALQKSVKAQEKNLRSLQKNNKALINWNRNTRNISTSLSVLRSKLLLVSFGYGLTLQKVRQLVSLYGEQEAAEAQVAMSLQSTGNASLQTSEAIEVMASNLQKATGVGDEMILRSSALLTTFTNISGNTFPKTQEAILDVTAAMYQGNVTMEALKTTTIQVGKALNDPVKGISALSRVGIQFTKQQKDMIKSLVETNQLSDAQAIILKELNRQFGGVASLDTYEKSARTLSAAVGDLGEKFGENLRPAIEELNTTLTTLIDKLEPSQIVKNGLAVITTMGAYAGLNKLLKMFAGVTLFRVAKGGMASVKALRRMTKMAGGLGKVLAVTGKGATTIFKLARGFSVVGIASTIAFAGISKLIGVFMKGEKPTDNLKERIAAFNNEINDLSLPDKKKRLDILVNTMEGLNQKRLALGKPIDQELVERQAISRLEETSESFKNLNNRTLRNQAIASESKKIIKDINKDRKETIEVLDKQMTAYAKETKVLRDNIKAQEDAKEEDRIKLYLASASAYSELIQEKGKELALMKETDAIKREHIKMDYEALDLTADEKKDLDGLIAEYVRLNKEITALKQAKEDKTKADIAEAKAMKELEDNFLDMIKAIEDNAKKYKDFMKPAESSLDTIDLIAQRQQDLVDSFGDNWDLLSSTMQQDMFDKIAEDTTHERFLENWETVGNGIRDMWGSLGDFFQNSIDNQRQALDKQSDEEVERVKNTSEYKLAQLRGDNAKMQKLEDDARKKNLEEKKKLFKSEQKLAVSNIIIDYLVGIAKETSKTGLFGLTTAGLIMTAASTAAIASILSQKPPEYAQGGDFITSGRQTITVGDNPGGQERVQITPLSSPNISNTNASGGNVSVVINNPVMSPDYTEDVIIPQIEDAIRRGAGTGILG